MSASQDAAFEKIVSQTVAIRRLEAITREMGAAMLRSARSPVFAENHDFVTAIFDGRGRMVAQTAYIPVLLGSLPFALTAIRDHFGGDIKLGDVFLLNDPYSGNNHLPDLTVARPVFFEDSLAFWAVTRGHHADVGGSSVGGYNPAAETIWEEGLRIPPVRLYRSGSRNDDVWSLVLANVRLRALVDGDLQCQVGATAVGERAVIDLLTRRGLAVVEEAVELTLRESEADVRTQIRRIPNGRYIGERTLDSSTDHGVTPAGVRVAILVEEEGITFDFDGSSEQVDGYYNSSYANTVASCLIALFSTIAPEATVNWGSMQPIAVQAPPGSIVNPSFGAATSMCTTVTCSVIVEAAWLALSQAVPEQSQALWSRRGIAGVSSGINPRTGREFAVIHNFSKGGSGACLGFDGWDHLSPVSSTGARAPDPELFELSSPHLLLECEYRPESAGAGMWRGGHGGRYRVQFLSDSTAIILEPSGVSQETAPSGIAGGHAAPPAYATVEIDGGPATRVDRSMLYRPRQGDVLSVYSSGGGGYGDPMLRPPSAVRDDVIDGLLSVGAAREQYGVVIDARTAALDAVATEDLRKRILEGHGAESPVVEPL